MSNSVQHTTLFASIKELIENSKRQVAVTVNAESPCFIGKLVSE
jgi:hypothetical protein